MCTYKVLTPRPGSLLMMDIYISLVGQPVLGGPEITRAETPPKMWGAKCLHYSNTKMY